MKTNRLLWLLFAAFLGAYAVIMLSNASRALVGSDGPGYLSAAKLLAQGKLSTPVPIPAELHDVENKDAFVPLAFVRQPGTAVMVPFYPVGFSLHLIPAALFWGWASGPFYVSPLASVGVVALVFFLARRFVSVGTSLLAAVCMACCAVLIFQGVQPMSDIVATFWCTAAVLASLCGTRATPAVLAGAALGIAVLVRPLSLLMLAPLLFILRPRQYLWAALGGLPFALFLGWYNWQSFGAPWATGYSVTGVQAAFAVSGFGARAAHYLEWTLYQFGPAALLASIASLWVPYAALRVRIGLLLWIASFLLLYSCYDPYSEWWYSRFLLPAYPGFLVTTFATVEFLFLKRTRWAIGAAIGIALITLGSAVATSRHLHVLFIDDAQRPAQRAGEWLRENLPRASMVVSMEMSGAILYSTSHVPVRWDRATNEELHRWAETARLHKRSTWAILMPHELEPVRERFGDSWYPHAELDPFRILAFDHPARGYVDGLRDHQLSGWAYDPNREGQPSLVRAVAASSQTRRVGPWRPADLPRPDLVASGTTETSHHGFVLALDDLEPGATPYRLEVEVLDEPRRKPRTLPALSELSIVR